VSRTYLTRIHLDAFKVRICKATAIKNNKKKVLKRCSEVNTVAYLCTTNNSVCEFALSFGLNLHPIEDFITQAK